MLNDVLIDEEIFPNFACWKCYENLKPFERLVKVNCKHDNHDGEVFSVPGFVTSDEACEPFDHRTRSISALVQSSLPDDETFERWKICCADALKCCAAMIQNYHAENFFSSCDNHWDGSRCFFDTYPENTIKQVCPYHFVRREASKCERELNFFEMNLNCTCTMKKPL